MNDDLTLYLLNLEWQARSSLSTVIYISLDIAKQLRDTISPSPVTN